MAPDKVMYLFFVYGVEVLKLVYGTELDNIQSIG